MEKSTYLPSMNFWTLPLVKITPIGPLEYSSSMENFEWYPSLCEPGREHSIRWIDKLFLSVDITANEHFNGSSLHNLGVSKSACCTLHTSPCNSGTKVSTCNNNLYNRNFNSFQSVVDLYIECVVVKIIFLIIFLFCIFVSSFWDKRHQQVV